MMKRTNVWILGLLLVLSSCAVGPKFSKPEIKAPARFRYETVKTDSVTTLAWWELFQDTTLEQLIDTALLNNKDISIAASRVQQAWASVGYYRADQFPKFDISANAMRGNFFGSRTALGNNFYGVAQLSWELDFWGKYRRMTEAARAELLASEYGMRSVQVSLISAVAVNYIMLLDYRERLLIAQQTLGTRDSALVIINQRYSKGIIPEIDVNQAEIQKAIAAASIPTYERAVAQTENALSILLGKNPAAIEVSTRLFSEAVPPEIPAGIPSELLQRRPDILQAEELYHAQNARIGVAQAMRFPSISLTGLLGVASPELNTLLSDGLAWSIGGSLLAPVFQFNKNKRRAQIEIYRTEEALKQYENITLQAFREVNDALISISTLKDELVAREQQYASASNAERLSQARYDRGVTSYLEVLESERASFEAQLSYSQVYQEYLNSYVDLYRALGGGWITKEEKTRANQADSNQK